MDPACLGFRVQMDLGCLRLGFRIWGFPKIRGTILGNFGEPYDKNYSNLVCILGAPYLGKLPFRVQMGLGFGMKGWG